jgi:hypothetical protein
MCACECVCVVVCLLGSRQDSEAQAAAVTTKRRQGH